MADAAKQEPVITMWSKEFTYDRWMKTKGIPIHRGYFIEDLRTIELEWWEERGCKAAFIQLLGQEGVSASRVTEVPSGKSLPPVKFALDEIVYVLSGRGLTTVWANEGKPKKNFEWQEHSMFLVPRNHWHVFSNMQGDKPIRLFHYSYMPMAMSALPESSTRMALASPVTWTSSTSRPSIHPFFWATRYGSENVVTGPGKTILILAATATGASTIRTTARQRVEQNKRHRTRW